MNNHRVFIGLALTLLLALAPTACNTERFESPLAEDGSIDLSTWDFATEGLAKLDGNFGFAWQKVLEPMALEDLKRQYDAFVPASSPWTHAPNPHRPDENFPDRGFATYALDIKLPATVNTGDLSLWVPTTTTACDWAIYTPDGQTQLAQGYQGTFGTSMETNIPTWRPSHAALAASDSKRVVLLIRISNMRDHVGGLKGASFLGTHEQVSQHRLYEHIRDGIMTGILFIVALYHGVLFLQRREDLAALYFGLLCGIVCIRTIVMARFPQLFGMDQTLADFELLSKIEFMTMQGGAMAMGLFLLALLPNRRFKQAVNFYMLGLGACFWIFVLSTTHIHFNEQLWLFQFHLVGSVFILLAYLIDCAYRGESIAQWVLAAFLIMGGGVINDNLYAQRVIDTAFIASYCFIAFVLLQSAILSGKAARAFSQAEHLSENLQREVREQTQDLARKTLLAQEATLSAVNAKDQAQRATQEALRQKAHAETARLEAEILRSEAEQHAEALEVLDQQKTAFFQNMSHELRTPLTLILSPLEQATLEHEEDRNLSVATKNARRLLRLVNQLLDFQKLEAGKFEIQSKRVNLVPLVHTCGEYFATTCKHKGIGFQTLLGDHPLTEAHVRDFEVTVSGEVDALEKIIFNFLSNALKFTPSGGHIALCLHAYTDRVRIEIRDTGPGISPTAQAKLFEVFSQVDETTTRAYEGTGLGLALTKTLAEAMDGQVGVDSTVGQGSTFYAEFNKLMPEKPALDLLLIDDDPDTRKMVQSLMRRSDSIESVQSVSTTNEVRMVLKERSVRCILCDYILQGEDGLSLLREMEQETPDTYRVLMTGYANDTKFDEARRVGTIHEIFFKPVDNQELLRALDQMVSKSRSADHHNASEDLTSFQVKSWLLSEEGQTGVEEDDTQTGINDEGQTILVVDDLPDMRDLISQALRSQGYRVITAANGKSALEKLDKHRVELVITDWMMPEMSGPDLIAHLKYGSTHSHIPVILLTAKSDEESKVIGTEIGADAFMGKPFNHAEILSVVRNLLSLKSREREIEALNHQLTEHVLKRYLPPSLVEDIVRGDFEFSVEPTERLITIIFSDLCGFTQLGEKLRTEHYAAQLNDYLTVMNEIIFEYGGTVDKFMGDAIMVLFGTPSEMTAGEQAERATTCALAMQAQLEKLNIKWQTQKLPSLKARIGIHQGKAVVGNFGSARRSDYTCIGRSVNLASRIESVCTPGSVFVSEQVQQYIAEDTRKAGQFELKGIDGLTTLYELT